MSHHQCKSNFGLGEIQFWSKTAAVLAVQWQAWVYGVLVLAGYRAWGMSDAPIRPPGRWWNGSGRWSLDTLWRGYRAEPWGSEEFRPVFLGNRGRVTRKGESASGYGQRGGGLAARIAITESYTDYFQIS